MSDIRMYRGTEMAESKPITWRLAPGYLQAGRTNLLVGDEGIGKSMWTIAAVTAITTGKSWGPFTIEADPADALIITTEDGWEDSVRPRLEVAGADLQRVCALCETPDGEGHPIFPRDNAVLQRLDITPDLVIVDSWVDTVDGYLTLRDTQKAREALRPWKQYAAHTDAAVCLVTHTNRLGTGKARDNYGLSAGLRQAVRSSLYALEENDQLVIGPEKSNSSALGVAQRFLITPVQHFPATDDNDGTVPRLSYVGADTRTIRDIVSQQISEPESPSKDDEIDRWLTDLLSDGPLRSATVTQTGVEHGYSEGQIKRARKRIDARCFKVGVEWFTEMQGQSGKL